MLIDTAGSYAKGNNFTFLLGSDAISSPGITPMGSGEGIDLSFRHFTGGVGELSPIFVNELFFIVGRID